jgi:alpha-L-fucosidase
MTSDGLVDTLVDIVSKNGNMLLDVGPRGDGSIPELMQQRLRDIGAWLKINGEAIYGTTYWNHAEQPGSNVRVRYTSKNDALYAIALDRPNGPVRLGPDAPVAHNSRITLLGSAGQPLSWSRDPSGWVLVQMPSNTAEQHAYTFKITTPGVETLLRSNLELPPKIRPGEIAKATLRVTNTGSESSRPTSVWLTAASGIVVQAGRVDLLPMRPGDTRTVSISVSAASRVEPGIYPVTLRVADDKIDTSTSVPLRVVLENVAGGEHAPKTSVR